MIHNAGDLLPHALYHAVAKRLLQQPRAPVRISMHIQQFMFDGPPDESLLASSG